MMLELFNINTEVEILYDQPTDRMRVRDTYGEFIPFPFKQWYHCVEIPYNNYFRGKGKPYTYVVEILLREYKHRYICNN